MAAGEAERVARALGGRKKGDGWLCRCPAHDDATPSLSVSEGAGGKLLMNCYAGCPFEKIMATPEVVSALSAGRGMERTIVELRRSAREAARPGVIARDQERRKKALRFWRAAQPAEGTPVEDYLRARGLAIDEIPKTLRFEESAAHHETGLRLPAMLALVQSVDGEELGVHRTYLRRDGSGKADVTPARRMYGALKGGAVRLSHWDTGEGLVVAEGIETALSVLQVKGVSTWAALSAPFLREIALPDYPLPALLWIAADNDEPGRAAAEALEARALADKRSVAIWLPPSGMDFNDLLRERGADAVNAHCNRSKLRMPKEKS